MTTKNTRIDNDASVWATVIELSETYNISTSSVRRWIKKYDDVRYFQESNLLRIHRQDFADLVDSFVENRASSQVKEG